MGAHCGAGAIGGGGATGATGCGAAANAGIGGAAAVNAKKHYLALLRRFLFFSLTATIKDSFYSISCNFSYT